MFPPPPAAHFDWTKLGLTPVQVNGHVESRYSAKTGIWTEPTFIRDPHISIHGLAPGLNYGQQVYEGLKAFRTPNDTIQIFRPDFHGTRLVHSASFVSIPAPPLEHFKNCLQHAVALNAEFVPPASDKNAFLYIRPLLFGSSAQLALSPPEEYILAIYVHPTSAYHGTQALDAVVLEDFDRAAPMGTGSAKVGGNYAPIYQWSAKAKEEEFGITLHLDSATRSLIEEFSTSGFVGITTTEADETVMVVPETNNAIRSCTTDSMVMVAEHLGWHVERKVLPFESISSLKEVFAVGTAAAAVPIRSITRKSTGQKFAFHYQSQAGRPSTGSELVEKIAAIQRGHAPDEFAWCWEIDDVPGATRDGQDAGMFDFLLRLIWRTDN